MPLTTEQAEYVQGLRDLADYLEDRPELIPDYAGVTVETWVYANIRPEYKNPEGADGDRFIITDECKAKQDADVKEQMAKMARLMGACDKQSSDYAFGLVRKIGPHRVIVEAARDAVCTRKVVGTKEVEQIDYRNAPRIMVTEDVVEWECPDSILRPTS